MTGFPELDALLADLLAGQREALGDDFVGTYLTGSFAIGDADEWSDVDFLCVVERTPTKEQQMRLRELHARLFDRETPWAQHLEGSYAPRDELRVPTADKWFYFDNGSIEPEWDTHCNTPVVRWTLRERPTILAGPDPRRLIDPVSPDTLRREARAAVADYARWAHEPQERFASGMSRWRQPYLVLTLCRALHTVESGAVGSKRAAGVWALRTLPREWHDLIERALADRPHPWERVHEEADAALAERTIAFADSLVSGLSRVE